MKCAVYFPDEAPDQVKKNILRNMSHDFGHVNKEGRPVLYSVNDSNVRFSNPDCIFIRHKMNGRGPQVSSETVEKLRKAQPRARVVWYGDVSRSYDVDRSVMEQFRKATTGVDVFITSRDHLNVFKYLTGRAAVAPPSASFSSPLFSTLPDIDGEHRLGDLEISVEGKNATASIDGRPINKITPMHARMLAALAVRQDTIIPREDMMDILYKDAECRPAMKILDVFTTYTNRTLAANGLGSINAVYGNGRYVDAADFRLK